MGRHVADAAADLWNKVRIFPCEAGLLHWVLGYVSNSLKAVIPLSGSSLESRLYNAALQLSG